MGMLKARPSASYTKGENFWPAGAETLCFRAKGLRSGHDDQPDKHLEFGRRNFGNDDPGQEKQPSARPQAQHQSRLQPRTQLHAG